MTCRRPSKQLSRFTSPWKGRKQEREREGEEREGEEREREEREREEREREKERERIRIYYWPLPFFFLRPAGWCASRS